MTYLQISSKSETSVMTLLTSSTILNLSTIIAKAFSMNENIKEFIES